MKNSQSGEVLYYQALPRDIAGELIAYFKQAGVHCHTYIDDQLFMESLTPQGKYYEELAGVKACLVDDLAQEARERDAMKIMAIIENEAELLKMQNHVNENYGHLLHITRSKPLFLEAMALKANKGLALQVIAEHYGIKREEVMAIGDSYNDLDMIRWAGIGVAMDNARTEVKAVADYITASNEDEGVAEALHEFIIDQ